MRKRFFKAIITAAALLALTGCTAHKSDVKSVKLDPGNPVSLTIWHYYNGMQQAIFDEQLEEFNATVGKEKGIYVEGYSQGSVSDLEKAVSSALKGEVGAGRLPDIFSSYADTAYSVQKQGRLAALTDYFTKEELDEYVDSYIEEGYFDNDGKLYLLPVAKSTEIMMLNKTDWEPFAEATGTAIEELDTTEGIVSVAQKYYEWTDSLTPDIDGDGRAFYGRDSMSNYFVIGMRQMGKEIFEVKDGEVTINTDKELIRRLWDCYYVPYIKGYFTAYGRFRSDDVRTGDILAYTGSVSSASYFPDKVENENEIYDIDYIVKNAPVMEGGERYLVQQGAGMAVTKSDEQHEYAACVFLKWFTQKENNLKFACQSSYMPVLKGADSVEALDSVIKDNNMEINDKVYTCLKEVLSEIDDVSFYTSKNCENGYNMRKVLDYNLSDRAAADRAALDEAVAAGADRSSEIEKYISDDSFESWYEDFCMALNNAAGK